MKDCKKTQAIVLTVSAFVLGTVVSTAVINANHSDSHVSSAKDLSTGQKVAIASAVNTSTVDSGASVGTASISRYPATKRADAVLEARRGVGRIDPMKAFDGSDETSSSDLGVKLPVGIVASKHKVLAPPPAPALLPISELPPPPNPPVKNIWKDVAPAGAGISGVKLTAVIGDKAMLCMRREGSSRSERPEVVCLAAGEQARTIDNVPVSVVSVAHDRVVFEVGGDRFVRSLPEIR